MGTNLDDEHTRLTIVWCILHPRGGLNNLFWGPKCCKISLEKHLLCLFLQSPLSYAMFDCGGLHWATLW